MHETSSYFRPRYLPQLDGFRAIAMAMVVTIHLPAPSDVSWLAKLWHIEHALRLGTVALDMFFVLSGFLITRLLLGEREAIGRIDLGAFYLRRALRIFPIYYLALIGVLIVDPTSLGRAVSLASYAYNYYLPFHPTPYPLEQCWSLAVEEQFYVLWPAALIAMPRRWLRPATLYVIPALAIGAAILYSLTAEPNLAAELIYMTLPTKMLPLALGCYLAAREYEGRAVTLRTAIIAIGGGMGMLASASVAREVGLIPAGGWYWSAALPGFAIAAFGMVAVVAGPNAPRWLIRPLCLQPLRYVGRISYGAYLYHLPILFALGINAAALDEGPAPIRWSVLAIALTLLVASASWHLIERPLIRLKDRIARPRTVAVPAPV